MYFAGTDIFTSAANRTSLISANSKGLIAAQKQVSDSRLIDWTNICFGPTAPTVFSHPRDTSGCVGVSSTKFKVTIATTPGMAFKWQRFVQSASVPGWSNPIALVCNGGG